MMTAQGHNAKMDILVDILADTSDGRIKGLEDLNELVHAIGDNTGSMAGTPPQLRRKKQVRCQDRPAKHKTTHYLSEGVFEDLGEAKEKIKDLLPASNKKKATKSAIIESAVKVLLNEFEKKGKNSYLVKELLQDNL
jgi:hypothetical protein